MNDEGFFTNTEEILAEHGDEDTTWYNMIHEKVSCSRLFDMWSLP